MTKIDVVEPVRRRFLTRKEAASYLGISMHTMQMISFNRKIRFYRPNKRDTYYDVNDLDAYIMGGEVIEACKDESKIVRGGRLGRKKIEEGASHEGGDIDEA